MSEAARDLLVRGIASAKAGETDIASRYLERCLMMDPSMRQRVDAHLWLAKLSATDEEKEAHLTEALQLEPSNFGARRDLALIRRELREEELVDPAAPNLPEAAEGIPIRERRYVCPRCGGRMSYEPRTHRLTCSYCGHQAHLADALASGAAVAEEAFIRALATAKGHRKPESTPTFQCEACGATYLLEAETLSLTCAHCGSTYAIEHASPEELIPPQGIVPFSVSHDQANRGLRRWLESSGIEGVERISELRGVYLPAWTFDITGEAPFRYKRRESDVWIPARGNELVLHNDLPVPASHRLPETLVEEFHSFDLSDMKTYDGARLAGWPAETYQIPPADAAMAARWHVVKEAREKANSQLYGQVKDFQMSATELLISAYRLVLLPFWLAEYTFEGERYRALVNGQTGAVRAEQPRRGFGAVLRWLLGKGRSQN